MHSNYFTFQVIAEDGSKEMENKRQVSVLARDGHLPFDARRSLGQKKPDLKTAENWNDDKSGISENPSVVVLKKRYVGALAKSGDLRFKERYDKREEDVDTLIDELLTAEELKKIRLEALRDGLMKARDEGEGDEETDFLKPPLSYIEMSGSIPQRYEKKSSATFMEKPKYFQYPSRYLLDDYDKRGIASMARNGQLPAFGKRGGISSIMRNGYPYQKRAYDTDFDYDNDDDTKRNVASLVRSYKMPSKGKRNVASLAGNGWIKDLNRYPKRTYLEDSSDIEIDQYKRNLPSLLRYRVDPIVEGKRYLGAFIASNAIPYSRSRQSNDGEKRNIATLARNWDFPEASFVYEKRGWYDFNEDNNDFHKKYMSSLLKQGPVPLSSENTDLNNEVTQSYDEGAAEMENSEDIDEQKRHIGSVFAHKNYAMRKKKSITFEDQFGEEVPTVISPTMFPTDENKLDNDIQNSVRYKRSAHGDLQSDEFAVPVMQNADSSEYDGINPRVSFDENSTRKKRYFGKLINVCYILFRKK